MEKLQNVLGAERLEQVKQGYAAKGDPVPDKFWTCCHGVRFSPGCNVLSRHVCSEELPFYAAPKGA